MAVSNRSQKRRRQLIIVLALFVGLVGYGFYLLTSEPEPQRSVRQRSAGEVAMPVLRRNLSIGSVLDQQDLRIVYTAPDKVPDDAIIRMDLFAGRWVTRNLRAGDYIKEEYLAEQSAPKGFSGLVDPGHRVIVLPVSGIEGTIGYLNVGDRLDIAAGVDTTPTGGRTVGGNSQPGQAGRRVPLRPAIAGSLELLAEAAQVLEIPQPGPFRRGQVDREKVVLAMSMEEAYQVQLAHVSGRTLRFFFRPFNEKEPSAPAVTSDPSRSPVRVIKGTSRDKVTTRNLDYLYNRDSEAYDLNSFEPDEDSTSFR